MNDTLVVLARAPIRGAGKTRLRAVLGGLATDRLVEAMLDDTLDWAQRFPADLLIAHDGPAAALAGRPGAAPLVAQPDGDFGARITAALDAAFLRGAHRAVLIGSDSPTLPQPRLQECFARLGPGLATLVGAEDGGWVAMGVAAPLGSALEGVTWSSQDTLARTCDALRHHGLDPVLLEPWYDVDDLDSLRRVAIELADDGSPVAAPRTADLLRSTGPPGGWTGPQ